MGDLSYISGTKKQREKSHLLKLWNFYFFIKIRVAKPQRLGYDK